MASQSGISSSSSRVEKKKPILILVRGPIATGKSTIGKYFKEVHNYHHMETDMYFYKDGVYCFDQTRLEANHKRCLEGTMELLKRGKNVVVTNTFRCRWEMKPYLELMKIATVHVYRTTDYRMYKPDKPIPEHAVERSYSKIENLNNEQKVYLQIDPDSGKRTLCYGERKNS